MIQTQYLSWEPYPARGAGAQRRKLRQDAATGAETFVLRLPPGYALGAQALLENDTELFVLHGEIEINGQVYHRDCYAMHPAGYAHNSFTAPKGATLIVITTGGPDMLYRGKPKVQFRRERLAERVDGWMLDWSVGPPKEAFGARSRPASPPFGTPAAPPAVFSKLLWEDPDTKGHTFLVAAAPRLVKAAAFPATTDAEIFVLQGDYSFAAGPVTAGGYTFQQAGIDHGAVASEGGCHALHKLHGPILRRTGPAQASPGPAQPVPMLATKALPLPEWWD